MAGIQVVPFYVTFDGKTYQKEIEEISVREFYQEMVDDPDKFPKSSLPSVQDYVEAFTPYARDGKDIICLCITTKFSGSYNSAKTAADLLAEEYPHPSGRHDGQYRAPGNPGAGNRAHAAGRPVF